MTNAMVQTGAPLAPQELVDEFLRGLSPNTHRAYAKDVRVFAEFTAAPSVGAAAGLLIQGGPHAATLAAIRWRDSMKAAKLSPATINRRLASLRSLVDFARTLGMVNWDLRVKGEKRMAYRDVRGCDRLDYRDSVADATPRDAAMLRLLGDLGLRRQSIVDLELSDVDERRGTIMARLKGRRMEPVPVTMAGPTRRALSKWIKVRGKKPGPLFPGRFGGTINAGTINDLTARYELGNPHGLRHSAITAALDATKGDVRRVKAFAHHADVNTTMRYDDARQDFQGQVAGLVAVPDGEEE